MTAVNIELSERELEILKLVATGASNKEIAQTLYISANTVKVHLRNIFAKTHTTTRTEAAMYAVQVGLVQAAQPAASEEASLIGDDGASRSSASIGSQALAANQTPVAMRRYTTWIAIGVILLLALVVVWAATAGGPSVQATPFPSAPVVEARWQEKAGMPSSRAGLALAASEGALYAIGGENQDGVLASVDRYSDDQDSWQGRAKKPTAVADAAAAVIGGKVYVPGGRLASGEMSSALEIYDPVADTWESGADLPIAVSAYALAALEGKLYLFGGWDGSRALNSVYQYDPGPDRWSKMTDMPTRRARLGAAVSGGRIYVLGGYNGQKALTVNEVYQPAREGTGEPPWIKSEPMPEGRYDMGVASVVETVYLVGGVGGETSAPALAFAPGAATWQALDLPVKDAWSRMGLVLSGQHLYLLGGELAGAPTDRNLAYQAIYTVSIPSIIK